MNNNAHLVMDKAKALLDFSHNLVCAGEKKSAAETALEGTILIASLLVYAYGVGLSKEELLANLGDGYDILLEKE